MYGLRIEQTWRSLHRVWLDNGRVVKSPIGQEEGGFLYEGCHAENATLDYLVQLEAAGFQIEMVNSDYIICHRYEIAPVRQVAVETTMRLWRGKSELTVYPHVPPVSEVTFPWPC
jgi:hypothetical protein